MKDVCTSAPSGKLAAEIEREIGYRFPAGTVFAESDAEKGFSVERRAGEMTVRYSSANELARAALVAKTFGTEGDFAFRETVPFEDVCLMVDCSRNAVRNVETVKKLIRNIALCGYNSLMLYTEDTYEIDGEPLFGYLRGRYSRAELKELDAYAALFGVELIPCIQTLAHLQALRRYGRFAGLFDADYTLMVGDERVYALIEKMFRSLSDCFSARRIHIGMDEPYCLGRGRYLDENGYEETAQVYFRHFVRVVDLAKKYGLKPIVWSDAFLTSAYRDGTGEPRLPAEVKAALKTAELMHWDYYHTDCESYEEKFRLHEKLRVPFWFASTAWENRGMLPHNTYSCKVCDAAMPVVKEYGVRHIMQTMWGDDGNDGSLFGSLPALVWFSLRARGREEDDIKKEFFALTGYAFDEFNRIEYPQTFCGKYTDDRADPAKYGLYNDVFSGWLDPEIDERDDRYFRQAAKEIRRIPAGQYAYLFDTAAALSDVLAVKYGVGIRLRRAYKAGDRAALKKIVSALGGLERKLSALLLRYRAQWYRENKPGGFEMQEIRLGGLKERIKSCRLRLKAWLAGEIAKIDELEEELLPEIAVSGGTNRRVDVREYRRIVSLNRFDDNLIF